MKTSTVINIIAFLFVFLFLYTAGEKFIDISQFREELRSSPLVSPVAGVVAWALPVTECLTAVLLFVPGWRRTGLYVSLIMMTLFTVYVSVLLGIDNHLACSCGGVIEDLGPQQHIWFNLSAVLLAGLGVLLYRRPPDRKVTRRGAAGVLILLTGVMSVLLVIAGTRPRQVRTGMEGRLLPSFQLQLADSTGQLNTADIPKGKPFIMMGFSPYCVHCQHETREIIKHIQTFRDCPIYLVTPMNYQALKEYYTAFHLERYSNVIAGVDSLDVFMRYFKSTGIPYIAVFDGKKRMKISWTGIASAAELTKSLQE